MSLGDLGISTTQLVSSQTDRRTIDKFRATPNATYSINITALLLNVPNSISLDIHFFVLVSDLSVQILGGNRVVSY